MLTGEKKNRRASEVGKKNASLSFVFRSPFAPKRARGTAGRVRPSRHMGAAHSRGPVAHWARAKVCWWECVWRGVWGGDTVGEQGPSRIRRPPRWFCAHAL